jgi:hypothetical protein
VYVQVAWLLTTPRCARKHFTITAEWQYCTKGPNAFLSKQPPLSKSASITSSTTCTFYSIFTNFYFGHKLLEDHTQLLKEAIGVISRSRDTVVSTVTRLRAGQFRVRMPAGERHLYLLRNVQTGSGAHHASYSLGTRDSSPRGTAAGTCG